MTTGATTLVLGVARLVTATATLAVGGGTISTPDVHEAWARERALARREMTGDRVREIVASSPADFIAAVQEVVDDSDCYGPADGGKCLLEVRVVEYLGGNPGRPPARAWAWSSSTLEMRMKNPWPRRSPGRRRLVLATPVRGRPGVYGNRLLLIEPEREDIELLRRLVREAIGS